MLCWVFKSEFMQLPKAEGQTDRQTQGASGEEAKGPDRFRLLAGWTPSGIYFETDGAGRQLASTGRKGRVVNNN